MYKVLVVLLNFTFSDLRELDVMVLRVTKKKKNIPTYEMNSDYENGQIMCNQARNINNIIGNIILIFFIFITLQRVWQGYTVPTRRPAQTVYGHSRR